MTAIGRRVHVVDVFDLRRRGPQGRGAAQRRRRRRDRQLPGSPRLHERYKIDAVLRLVVADADGVVHAGFLGPMTATDLWAAVNAREPGSIQTGACDDHD